VPREIGKTKKVPITDLCVGHKLLGDIRGAHGKILMAAGEILTQHHINWIKKVEARPGMGRLSLYTRDVYAVMTDASGDEEPACLTDPEKAHSLQKWYKRGKIWCPPNQVGTRIQSGFDRKAKERLKDG